ncbi:serine hydrolase [Larkinella bovis]|uniref:Serine hydrolase n=1 Tax=Larkinella bovis TaxID=683041 RepID=A0ABW0I6R2_9BACT
MRFRFCFRLMVLLLPLWIPRQPVFAQLTLPARIDRFVQQVMDSANVPGLSLALIRNGNIAYSQGYGLVRSDSSQKVTAATVFDAASLSKPVFAYAVLQWVDEGQFDLDKPLYQYLPYPDIESDERYKAITARMVLSHRTGFPNWRGSQKLSIKNPPGQQFGYSGEGFVYLQKVIEALTGKPLNEWMNERVFRPLHMTRSGYVWRPDFDSDFAYPHTQLGRPRPKQKPRTANTAYSLQITADDYAKFILAILRSQGLKPATRSQLLTPQTPLPTRFGRADTTRSKALFWGLGFGLEKTPSGDYFWHWGDNGTFRCFVAARPATSASKTDAALVYFTNSFNGLAITDTMLANLLGGQHPAVAFLNYDSYTSPENRLAQNILKKGVQPAIQSYLSTTGKSPIPEELMNQIGYQLLDMGRLDDAVAVLKFNAESYPASANVYDSYGYALLRAGNPAEAIRNYRRALELEADLGDAKTVLAGLAAARKAAGSTKITLKGYPKAKLVTLAGAFNDWNHLSTFFTQSSDDWVCTLDLKPGTYAYKIVVDGHWMTDPGNPVTQKTGDGNTNSVLTVP